MSSCLCYLLTIESPGVVKMWRAEQSHVSSWTYNMSLWIEIWDTFGLSYRCILRWDIVETLATCLGPELWIILLQLNVKYYCCSVDTKCCPYFLTHGWVVQNSIKLTRISENFVFSFLPFGEVFCLNCLSFSFENKQSQATQEMSIENQISIQEILILRTLTFNPLTVLIGFRTSWLWSSDHW